MKKFSYTAWKWFLRKLSRGSRANRILHNYQNSRTSEDVPGLMKGTVVSYFRGFVLASGYLQELLFSSSRVKTKISIDLDDAPASIESLICPRKDKEPVIDWLAANCQYPAKVVVYYSRFVTMHGNVSVTHLMEVEFTMPSDAMLVRLRFT